MQLFYDTETTGKFDFKAPPDAPHQPRLVQLGVILDDDTGKTVEQLNTLILPDGFSIPDEARRIHGISTAQANAEGLPLAEVLDTFEDLCNEADLVVAHNVQFDVNIMLGEYLRAGRKCPLVGKPTYCTMLKATNVCRIPGRRGGYKWPTLDEAYRMLVNEGGFSGAHDAFADIVACRALYYKLIGVEPAKEGLPLNT